MMLISVSFPFETLELMPTNILCCILFCGSLNDAVSNSVCIVSGGTVISEQWIGKDVELSSSGTTWGIILEFALMNWGKSKVTLVLHISELILVYRTPKCEWWGHWLQCFVCTGVRLSFLWRYSFMLRSSVIWHLGQCRATQCHLCQYSLHSVIWVSTVHTVS